MTGPILETRNLDKAFGAVIAAAAVTIRVEAQEIVGVIGANGAGKTTFINMVTGYLKPDAGTILYRGRNITSLRPREITRLGICRSFQIPQLFAGLTVLDNMLVALGVASSRRLGFWRALRSPARIAAAERILADYGLGDVRDRAIAVLPQGVRKLLDIAMTTVGKPAIVLLDEPTSGISVDEKFAIMDTILAALRASQATILFIEHDMEIVERHAERVVAFYDGRVIADGPTRDVLANADVRQYVIGAELHRRR
jgi:branched-chain amino acid transport system ATP-binding protein